MSRESFISSMYPHAKKWEEQTGIPAEVFIAIGGSETNWGAAGGFFGIKGKSPKGKSANYATFEYVDGKRVDINDDFAVYDNPDEGFQHFIGLVSSGRYKPAWDRFQQTGNWRDLIQGINAAGYATDTNWHRNIESMASGVSNDVSGGKIAPSPARTGSGGPMAQETRQSPLDYFLDYQRKERALNDYLAGKDLVIDRARGVAGRIETTTDRLGQVTENFIQDQRATELVRAANFAEQTLKSISDYKNILGGDADNAAKAYRDSEVLRGDEADKQYTSYRTRIQDIESLEQAAIDLETTAQGYEDEGARLEEIPLQRSADVASARRTAEGDMMGRQQIADQGGYVPQGNLAIPIAMQTQYEQSAEQYIPMAQQRRDAAGNVRSNIDRVRGVAGAIRGSVPSEVPTRPPIDQKALEPLPTGDGFYIPIEPYATPPTQPAREIEGPPSSLAPNSIPPAQSPNASGAGMDSFLSGLDNAPNVTPHPITQAASSVIAGANRLTGRVSRASTLPTQTGNQQITAPPRSPYSAPASSIAPSMPARQVEVPVQTGNQEIVSADRPSQIGNQQITKNTGAYSDTELEAILNGTMKPSPDRPLPPNIVRGSGPPPASIRNNLKGLYTGPPVWYKRKS